MLPEDAYERRDEVPNSSKTANDVASATHNGGNERSNDHSEPSRKRDIASTEPARKRVRGQNKGRKFTDSHDDIRLCPSRALARSCERLQCNFEHSLKNYIPTKPADIDATCPVYQQQGVCEAGFRCRWLSSHCNKIGDDYDAWTLTYDTQHGAGEQLENVIDQDKMFELRRRRYPLPKSDALLREQDRRQGTEDNGGVGDRYELPFVIQEKRKLDWSGAKVLAPLTTVGNLPFRRLCRDYGADATYSEMALSLPLLTGAKGDWALSRSHASERDTRNGRRGLFGMQLAGPKPFMNVKAAEILSTEFPQTLDFIDLNCGCPIDLVFKQGAGSALLDNHGRLLKILRGMSAVSGSTPITVKIRTGVLDDKHTAGKLLWKLQRDVPVDMVCLHGRSRRQRYSRNADWSYISECARQVADYKAAFSEQEPAQEVSADCGPASRVVNAWGYAPEKRLSFLGNGDVYTWQDYHEHIEQTKVDGCMVARGALIKPWVFEEIDRKVYLDYDANERMRMLQRYCSNGLEYWGSDQMGVDKTRRFLLEFLSFHHRYVPCGLLPQDTRPDVKGIRGTLAKPGTEGVLSARDDMEMLLSSGSAEDWIKISNKLLGRAKDSFVFVPKHKSSAQPGADVEVEAEG
ncbi:tRNA-dihydrouridine synthase 3 [Savitreella phatthalungensis]